MKPPLILSALLGARLLAAHPAPLAPADLVFAEQGGLVAVEAEHFSQQELTAKRAWHMVTAANDPALAPDSDGRHLLGASGGAYLEILPDTRATDKDKLITGDNFNDEPGQMAVVSYKINFTTPGRYYVWVRCYSTGSEDNGVHVGLDGQWPESGRRWQTVQKNAWIWDCAQRTKEVHTGVPLQLFLDVPAAGEHVVQFSLREDGFEMDKFVLATNRDFKPEGPGPQPVAKSGKIPAAVPVPADYVEGYPPPAVTAKILRAVKLPVAGTSFYVDQGRWLAIDPGKFKEASIKATVPTGNARFDISLYAVGENDGQSSYEVLLGTRSIGTFTCPASPYVFEESDRFVKTWKAVPVSEGESVEVRAKVASADGKEYSRARWSLLVFTPVDTDPGQEQARVELAAAQRVAAMKPVARQAGGNGTVTLTGELKQWHKVTVELAGPFAAESDTAPNPFTDLRLDVTFTHESGAPRYVVPGYFAADGAAAHTSATAGTVWRAHLSPDKPGRWTYRVGFTKGPQAAMNGGGAPLAPFDGQSGSFTVAPTDKTGRDFRSKGRLTYTGGHYLKYAGTGEIFLKAGADAPETTLAYADFDDTIALKKNVPLKTWSPHVRDWRTGDPVWQGDKGKGLVGALNYLSAKGANSFSFLTYNAAGDGDNVWPFISRDEKFHYDCSKLDQWGIVFDHADKLGLFLHFKLQENENDDDRIGPERKPGRVPESLDGGATGPERRLYFRELIARFGHSLALNWNLGEENTQTPEEQRAMAQFISDTDPYHHLVVIHSFPEQQNRVYESLLGNQSLLTGASAQNSWNAAHKQTLKWVQASTAAGRPWVVCNDEQNPAGLGVPPDLGYRGYDGNSKQGIPTGYDENDIRKATLWGTLMAGGAGVEYYFGYQLLENDLLCEDFRSRDRSWDYCRIALEFFAQQKFPLEKMTNADALVGNTEAGNSAYCLAEAGRLYLVYQPKGGTATLDLTAAPGSFTVAWFNPRAGGALQPGGEVKGGAPVTLTAPSGDDWLAVVRAHQPVAWAGGTRVLLVGGGTAHDFPRFFDLADIAMLRGVGALAPAYTEDLGTALHALPEAAVLVLSTNQPEFGSHEWRAALARHLAAGRGLVLLHPGVWRNYADWPEYESAIAGALANSHPKLAPIEITVTNPAHPVMQGVPATFTVTDELYQVTTRPGSLPIDVLAQTNVSPGSQQRHPSVWTARHPTARVIAIAPGHDGLTHADPHFQTLLVNAVTWTAQPP